jgi:hypothetical protein
MIARAQERNLFAGMNKTERDWAIALEARRRAGGIREWHYGAVTLKIGEDCRYTPDFFVVYADGSVGFDEVKGFWREDAKVKLRAAAKQYPFLFHAVRRLGKTGWDVAEYTHPTAQPTH